MNVLQTQNYLKVTIQEGVTIDYQTFYGIQNRQDKYSEISNIYR